MAINALSILIPTYNDECVTLVDDLRQQAEQSGIVFEILVGDDGSTDAEVIEKNRKICKWPHCHYLIQIQNIGRAAIRNFLAKEAIKFEVKKANTVGDLLKTALDLLKK